MSLVQFVPGETVIHQLDPRTKLALVPFVFILAFILSKPLPLLIFLILNFHGLVLCPGSDFLFYSDLNGDHNIDYIHNNHPRTFL